MTTTKIRKIIDIRLNNFNEHDDERYALGYRTALSDLVRDINGAIQRELDGEMTELGERNYTLIKRGIKSSGSYDPNEIFCMFEEELYTHEAEIIWDFLEWVHNGKEIEMHGMKITERAFGGGTYEQRFQEFLEDKKTKV